MSDFEKPFCAKCENVFSDDTKFCPHDGTPLIIRAKDPIIGKIFDDRYQILHKIGSGGMGSVYQARQLSTEKIVAIKVISQNLVSDEETVKRFKREVKLQSMLEHPNIVTVIDFSKTKEDEYYFVMAFVKGKSLKKLILDMKIVPNNIFFNLALQICDALDYAHSQQIIHRDLKGENIIVVSYQHQQIVKILDFGIAKALDAKEGTSTGLTQTGHVLGTPSYMSPEQAKGEIALIGPPTDVYSIGVIFYQMLTGILPFHSDTPWGMLHKHIYEKPTSIRKKNPGVSRKLEKIIMHCLEKEPHNRYPSVAKLREDMLNIAPSVSRIKALEEDSPFNATTETVNLRYSPRKNRRFLFLLLILILAAFFIVKPEVVKSLFLKKKQHIKKPSKVIDSMPQKIKQKDKKADLKYSSTKTPPTLKPYGEIKITTDPSNAGIKFDSYEKKVTPCFLKKVPAGILKGVIELKGYKTQAISVNVEKNSLSQKYFKLVREKGSVEIKSLPLDAEILIDGKIIAHTPNVINELETGLKTITIQKKGYRSKVIKVEILPDKINVVPEILLVREKGSVEIKSLPLDAEILIDGKIIAHTPNVINDLETGFKTITIQKKGYRSKIIKVEILPDKINILPEILLEREKGHLIIKAPQLKAGSTAILPENGEIKIGTESWKAVSFPHLEKDIICGDYEIDLRIKGFQHGGKKKIRILDDETGELAFQIKALPGKIKIISDGSLEIMENKKKIGNSNQIISGISPGSHKLTLSANGYESHVIPLILGPGEYIEIKIPPLKKLLGTLLISSKVILSDKKKILPPPFLGQIKIGPGKWEPIAFPYQKILSSGNYNFEIKVDGYDVKIKRQFAIKYKDVTNLTALLTPKNSRIKIKSNSKNGKVYKKDRLIGSINEFLSFEPFIEHKLTVKAEGFQPKEIKICIKTPGVTAKDKFVTLEKAPEKKEEQKKEDTKPEPYSVELKWTKLPKNNPEGKKIKIKWVIRDSKKLVSYYQIFLNQQLIDSTKKREYSLRKLKEGKYFIRIFAVTQNGEAIKSIQSNFSVTKKIKHYHGM